MTKIDMLKQYRTRDGREVRIYATDGHGRQSIHGAVKNDFGWVLAQWREDGSMYGEENILWFDLIEVKPRIKREVWLNVYDPQKEDYTFGHPTKAEADRCSAIRRIACVKITIDCEEGEGL